MTMTKTTSTTTATTNRINQVGVHHHHHHHHQQQQSIIPMTNSTTTTNDDNIDVDDDCDGDSGLNQDIDHHHHHDHHNHDEDINKIRKKHCSPTLTPTISSSASSSPSSTPSTSPRSSILAKLIDNKNNHLFSDNNDSISSSSSQNSSCSNPASTLSQSHQHQEQQQLSSNIRQIDGKMQKSSPTPPPPPPPITIPRRSRQRKPVDLNNNNRKSTIDTSIVLLKKEKITRLDMVPDNDDEQNRKEEILTPVEIDSFNDGGVNGQTNKKKKINQKSIMDWKLKLTKELDLYQQILIERQQQQQSSHSAESHRQNRNVKLNVNHHHCHCHHHHHCHQQPHNHHHHYHQKSTKPSMKSNSNSNKQDSFGDSSWEETTTTSNTSDPANNVTNPTTATTTTTTESNEKKSKKPTTFLRGSRSASSQKSTTSWSKPNSQSSKNLVAAKRRSASFNKQQQQSNVRIITPYERIRQSLQMDKTWQKEIAFGRRIGLYRFRGDIGNGNFSQVKIAIHSLTKEKVAIKILDKSRLDMKTQKMLAREIRTMETLHHPNLIRIFEVIESFSKHFLIMELAPGGELFQVISTNGRFSELEAKHFFAQIISAIDHMHQHNLIHRDIKAENVFFSDPITVKVGDFGFSTRITSRDELLSTFCGSPPYAAPELFRDESYRGPYVDYWALGVLLYFIVTGMMPFRAQNIISLKKLILDCHYDIPNYVSLECCQLINGFLQADPLKRFTLEQARHTRWLQNQLNQRSLPKYDLKSSYGKLIQHRKMSTAVAAASESIDNGDHHEQYPPLNDDEKETFHQLMLLGIDEKILNDHIDKGSHSHIVGTFRILMHRILRQSSNERQRKQSKSNDTTTIGGDQWNPIRRTTSMSVAPLERIRAHYARKIPATKLVDADSKCPKLNDKSKNSKQLTKTIESSNDSTEKSRLQKIHNAINRTSTPPPPSKSNDQPESIEMKKDPSAKHMKNVLTKQNSESNQEKESKQQPSSRKFLENCIKNDNQHSNTVSSRLSRSFRTLKQLLTENNICGNHTTVVQPQTINIGGMNNKPHVIHKTTTLQIMPRSNPAKAPTNVPLLWPSNSRTGGGKLWRSQTTPDVSLIDGTMCIGNHAHHHHHNNNHRTLPCYHCDNQHYILPSSSNKKSFINPVNRCAII